MSLFRKKESYDLHFHDRSLQNMIDSFCQESPSYCDYYEDKVFFYVKEGIKYRKLLTTILEEGYEKHQRDVSCDIPDFKTFLSLEQRMIDEQEEYRNKSICVEGYVAYHLGEYGSNWTRDNAGVFIYPLPCKTESETTICHALMDDCRATGLIILTSDTPLPTERGTHIRVHGTPSFYGVPFGERPGKVHVLVKDYEILE